MKNKTLFLIFTLCSISLPASDSQGVWSLITNNPKVCAALGYALGSLGYKAIAREKINPIINRKSLFSDKPGTQIGLNFIGIKLYRNIQFEDMKKRLISSACHPPKISIYNDWLKDSALQRGEITQFDDYTRKKTSYYLKLEHKPVLAGIATALTFYTASYCLSKK